MKCQLERPLVRVRWSAAAAPPGKHTHTLSQLYNRTELSPVYREFKQLFDKILSTCLSHPTHTCTHTSLLALLLIHPHSFENKQSKEVSSVHPSFPLTHTCTQPHRKALAFSRKLTLLWRKRERVHMYRTENKYYRFASQTFIIKKVSAKHKNRMQHNKISPTMADNKT